MGSGDFGSNGSVHWRIIHTIDENRKARGFVRGRDPNVPCERPKVESLLPSDFVVTLRFNTRRQLEEALGNARSEGRTLVLRVPRREEPPNEPPETDWEVTVAWEPPGNPSGGRKARQKRP